MYVIACACCHVHGRRVLAGGCSRRPPVGLPDDLTGADRIRWGQKGRRGGQSYVRKHVRTYLLAVAYLRCPHTYVRTSMVEPLNNLCRPIAHPLLTIVNPCSNLPALAAVSGPLVGSLADLTGATRMGGNKRGGEEDMHTVGTYIRTYVRMLRTCRQLELSAASWVAVAGIRGWGQGGKGDDSHTYVRTHVHTYVRTYVHIYLTYVHICTYRLIYVRTHT